MNDQNIRSVDETVAALFRLGDDPDAEAAREALMRILDRLFAPARPNHEDPFLKCWPPSP
jgi:hypothetical protein